MTGLAALLLLAVQASFGADAPVNVIVDSPEMLVTTVRDLLRDGRFAEAEQHFERLVQTKPFTRDGVRLLEHLYSRLSEDESIAARILEWRSKVPPSRSALILSGFLHVKRGWRARGKNWARDVEPSAWSALEAELGLAQADLELAYSLGSEDPNAAARMVGIAGTRDVPKAVVEQWYSRAVQADPGAWGPRLSKLQSLFPKWGGSWPEAEAFANEAARLSPRGSRIFALPLYLMLEQADRSEDEADFLMSPEVQARFEPLARRWLAELPRSIEARRVIAKLKAKAGDHAAAMDLLSECLRIDPVEPKIRFQLGVELYGMKRYAEAETELNKARDLDPKEAGVWYYLGRVAFYGRNDDMAALAAFEKAAALEPWHITYVQYRGIAKVQLRNYHAGIQDLTAVIAKRPTRALAYFHRGRAYWALGREEEAEQDFAQAVRLDPDLARNVQKLKGKNR